MAPAMSSPTSRRNVLVATPAWLAAAVWGLPARAANPAPQGFAPRLGATPADWRSLQDRRQADPDLERLVTTLLGRARRDLALPPLERQLEGRRLLGVSREFIRRSLQWAFAYRLTSDPAFLDRAVLEMRGVSGFADWNPSHFLDVAEMTTGMALACDWLGADLAPADRAGFITAMVERGNGLARHGHKAFGYTHNWNQVCIGGMVLGALAAEEAYPQLAADLMQAAKRGVLLGLDAYRPDGVYPEGPGYWDYGTCYSVLLVSALRATRGTDWGVLDAPGFKSSARFFSQATGPSGKTFNFADGGEWPAFPCALVYLARELQQPDLLGPMRNMVRTGRGLSDRFAPLSALWWPAATASAPGATAFVGQGAQPIAMWRGSWQDPNTWWLAIKAGGAAHNHGHMDAGTFVLDMDGVRWAKDLGMQDYNSLESKGIDLWSMGQNAARWQVFRLSAQAHNTLTVDGQPHNARGMATLRLLDSGVAEIDLTPALLPGAVSRATRRVHFLGDGVQMDDEVQGGRPGSTIRWAMNTEADVSIDGGVAVLSQKGKRLVIRFEGTPHRLAVLDLAAPRQAHDAPNPNVKQLVVTGQSQPDGIWQLRTQFARR